MSKKKSKKLQKDGTWTGAGIFIVIFAIAVLIGSTIAFNNNRKEFEALKHGRLTEATLVGLVSIGSGTGFKYEFIDDFGNVQYGRVDLMPNNTYEEKAVKIGETINIYVYGTTSVVIGFCPSYGVPITFMIIATLMLASGIALIIWDYKCKQ